MSNVTLEADEEIIRLYGEGMTVEQVGRATKHSKESIRRRLVDCHPTKTGLL